MENNLKHNKTKMFSMNCQISFVFEQQMFLSLIYVSIWAMRNFITQTSFPAIFHISIHWAISMFIRFCYLLNGILMCLTVLSVTHEEGCSLGCFPPLFPIWSFSFLATRLHSFKYIMLAIIKSTNVSRCLNYQRFVN